MARERSQAGSTLLLGMTLVTALILTACSDSGSKRMVSPRQTTPQSASPTPASQKEAVEQAYILYLENTKKAILGPVREIRATLSMSVTGKFFEEEVRSAVKVQEEHRAPTGTLTPHFRDVTISGDMAIGYVCTDTRKYGFKNTQTGKAITRPPEALNEVGSRVRFALGGDGRWRVSEHEDHQESCSRS